MKISETKKRAQDTWNALQQNKMPKIFIGAATCGRSAGALAVKLTFKEELQKRGIHANIIEVGCFGPCYTGQSHVKIKPKELSTDSHGPTLL